MTRKGDHMSKPLGTSFVASQGERGRRVVKLAGLGAREPVDGLTALSLVLNDIAAAVEDADLGVLGRGKVIIANGRCEAGLFVDLSTTEGAAVTASCPEHLVSEVTLTVGRSSRALRSFMWVMLAVAVVAGLFIAYSLFPAGWEPMLKLALGLLLGAALAIGVAIPVSRTQLLAGKRSGELTATLDGLVSARVESVNAAATLAGEGKD
jgi:hypothetical protein